MDFSRGHGNQKTKREEEQRREEKVAQKECGVFKLPLMGEEIP